jgi:ATP synthase F1 delta subunit
VAAASRIYARALYDAARAQGKVAPVRQELEDFVVMTREVDELRELLRNPQLDPRAKAAALEAVSGGGDPLVRNFLLLLAEKGRAGELEDVQEEFERLVARAEGQLTVELTTAYELSETDARAIVEQIERIARRVQLDVGGIEFLIDDRDGKPYVYDVNALSNFVADAVNVVGFDPHERLVDYLEERGARAEGRELAAAGRSGGAAAL